MILMTTYKVKPFMTRAQMKEMMDAFAQFGTSPGTTAHYVFADGSGGVVFTESDNAAEGFRVIQNYEPWVQYESKVMLTIDEAVPHILDALT